MQRLSARSTSAARGETEARRGPGVPGCQRPAPRLHGVRPGSQNVPQALSLATSRQGSPKHAPNPVLNIFQAGLPVTSPLRFGGGTHPSCSGTNQPAGRRRFPNHEKNKKYKKKTTQNQQNPAPPRRLRPRRAHSPPAPVGSRRRLAQPCPCQDLYFNHFSWQARPACLRGDIFFCRQICLCTAARAGIASSSQERGPGKEPKQAQVF